MFDFICNNLATTARVTVTLALEFLCNWVEAKNIDTLASASRPVDDIITKWSKPVYPFLKCNVDAAIF